MHNGKGCGGQLATDNGEPCRARAVREDRSLKRPVRSTLGGILPGNRLPLFSVLRSAQSAIKATRDAPSSAYNGQLMTDNVLEALHDRDTT
jgi:hypothetical protein